MALQKLHANEDRRGDRGEGVDILFLALILALLAVGLAMLYSASFAQSEYDTGYLSSTKYLQKQALCAAIGLAAMVAFSRILLTVPSRTLPWTVRQAVSSHSLLEMQVWALPPLT